MKQREIVYLYKNEISQEEYFTDQHQKSIPGSFAQQQEDSIPDKDWVQAAQVCKFEFIILKVFQDFFQILYFQMP